MRRTGGIILAICVAVATLSGCSSDSEGSSSDGEDAAEETTTTAAETTTTTIAEPAGAPAEPLQPSTPEWAAACATGDAIIEQAWATDEGTLTEETPIAVSLLQMIDQLPAGTATEQVAYVQELLNAFLGGEDITSYQAAFEPNTTALLDAVAVGCGAETGEGLPLPPDSLVEVESFLFRNL